METVIWYLTGIPNLKETNQVFENTADYVEHFDATDRDMTKYVIGTISDMDTPLTPSAAGNRSMSAWLTHTTLEDLQRMRIRYWRRHRLISAAWHPESGNFWMKAVSAPLGMRAVSRRKKICLTGRGICSALRKRKMRKDKSMEEQKNPDLRLW